jgi:hypothetical protein
MSLRNRADDRIESSDFEYYIPAASPSDADSGLIERVWAKLFNHGIDTEL